jgi:hypothetical protein
VHSRGLKIIDNTTEAGATSQMKTANSLSTTSSANTFPALPKPGKTSPSAIYSRTEAQIIRYLDDKLTVVLFANQARTNQSKLAQGVAALFNAELAQ